MWGHLGFLERGNLRKGEGYDPPPLPAMLQWGDGKKFAGESFYWVVGI